MNENPLVARQLGLGDQRVISGQKRDRNGGAGFAADAGGQLGGLRGGHGHVGRKRRGGKGGHAIPGLQMTDVAAALDDVAGAFASERRAGNAAFQNFVRQERETPHHVAEIKSGRFDGDLDLVWSRRGALAGLPLQALPWQ